VTDFIYAPGKPGDPAKPRYLELLPGMFIAVVVRGVSESWPVVQWRTGGSVMSIPVGIEPSVTL
jgi:hypothetical protein